MTPPETGWSALKAVVAEALDLPADARESHIEARCPNPAQRAEAARLLRACERAAASPVLAVPAAEFAAPLLAEVQERESGVPEALHTALAGRYTIERELGRGGMATVYLARDERHGRPVAIKLLRPELVPEDGPSRGAARFQREIEFAARLSHPHILPLYDSGAAGGLLFYITPYVDGETLRDRLGREGRPPLPESLRLLRDVARALVYAHRQGLVHRDIKPANILLNQEGDALVADFGVAKALAAAQGPGDTPEEEPTDGVPVLRDTLEAPQPDLTDDALVLGTPAYMAPEQVRGDPGIDHRADLYAFGAVAYELLTGAPPFAGRPRHERLAAHLSEVPEPVATGQPDVPEALAALVERLLAKRPEDRPRDAAEVVELLEAAAASPASARLRVGEAGRARGGTRRLLKSLPLLALVLLSSAAPDRETPFLRARTSEASIAVLPFATRSGNLDDAAFGEGLADELVGALGKVPGVRVAGRTSAAALVRRGLDVRSIGETLDVETVVEGNVRRQADRLRVAANLVRARDGRVLWSESYEVPAEDLFAVQEQVARDIAAALSTRQRGGPLPDGLAERGTEDREAYDLYQKGRYLTETRQRDGLFRAMGYFEEAVARDSTYARAYAGMADALTFLAIFGHVPPREAFPRVRSAAERALAIDSRVVEARTALAHMLFVYEWNWEAAESALERAIALDPRYPLLRMIYASFLHSVGRPEEALAQLAIAKEIDPLTPTGVFGGRIYVDTHRPDAAIRVLEQEVELDPRRDLAHQLLAHAYLQKGMPDEAIASMRRAAALSGARDSAQLAYVYARTGHPAEARRVLARLQEGGRPLDPLGFHLAMAYAALGESNEAFRWLETAHSQHAGYMNLLAVTTGFESLRSDPRFDALLRRMELR